MSPFVPNMFEADRERTLAYCLCFVFCVFKLFFLKKIEAEIEARILRSSLVLQMPTAGSQQPFRRTIPDGGVNAALSEFGDIALARYNKTRSPPNINEARIAKEEEEEKENIELKEN